MGVPKFFRYISERYPCLSELVSDYQIPEFDNLYLDMNGIIHMCSHPDDGDAHFRITEERIFKDIFHYIEFLFRMIKPQKLFFMAIDGVAPRAKMNQQRGRRFRTAKESKKLEEEALAKGEKLPDQPKFDSNCITPGTEFMAKLHEQLKYFIVSKISVDSLWQKCKVILSGHETPGEGEHKIMDYIRYLRAQPGYDPNTRHCLYGLDADLVMLGLCTHEPHFSLLREEVKFGKKSTKRKNIPEQISFYLLHLSLLREYLELEFLPLKDDLPFQYDFERIIDDWVLMGFLVGNDFIPHLPNLHITSGALPVLYKAYMKVLPTLGGYINESGILNLERFEKFMKELAENDLEVFSDHYADLKWLESKTGRRIRNGKEDGELSDNEDLKNEGRVLDNWEDHLEETSESEDDLLLLEFKQQKTDYYMNKLEYETVTPEVLRDQAEGYVRAIQWNLLYYYHGVSSWSWYYPHHYAPYISDIQGFKDLKIEFDLGKPFKPFEQLLAVLPAASKNLLPEAYQKLMTDENSPIKYYYPENFKTDLNGKRQEWEAVVLIPFIDESNLLKAMETCNEKLSPEEKKRNEHGPMLIYQYSPYNTGMYTAPQYFPTLESTHFNCTKLSIEDIRIPADKLILGAYPGAKFDVFYPGFPTFKHLEYVGHFEKAKVKVFDQPSRSENMIVDIIAKKSKDVLNTLAQNMLGKIVFVSWPHLIEAKVIGISNENYRYNSISSEKGQYNVEENLESGVKTWKSYVNAIKTQYMTRWGINIGETDILVHVKIMTGRKYSFTPQGTVTLEKYWSNIESTYPYQAVVQDISVYEKSYVKYKTTADVFTVGAKCFMLGQPYYGADGEVLECKESLKSGRIKVNMKKTDEPDLSEAKQLALELFTRYVPIFVAASKLSISKSLFSRITGTVLIVPANYHGTKMNAEELPKVNVGLNLKFNKKNEEIPGYTKKDGSNWLYSEKTIKLVEEYLKTFPSLAEFLNKTSEKNDIYYAEEIFPGEAKEKLKEIIQWIKKQPYYSIEKQVCGSSTVEPDVVKKIEEIVENSKKRIKTKKVTMQVKPHLLYMVGLQIGNLVPDPTTTYMLYDRVVNVRESYTVPVGLKGTVVSIIKSSDGKQDNFFDVLFDEPFAGGLKLNSLSPKGYRLPTAAMINISHGTRQLNQKSGISAPSDRTQNATDFRNNNPYDWRSNAFPGPPEQSFPNSYNNYLPSQGYNPNVRAGPPPLMTQHYGPPRFPNMGPFPPPHSINSFVGYPLFGGQPKSFQNFSGNYRPRFSEESCLERKRNDHSFMNSQTQIPSKKIDKNLNYEKPINKANGVELSTVRAPKIDTELLKRMLRINDDSNNKITKEPIKNKTSVVASSSEEKSSPLNIEEIFAHAKNKVQTLPSDTYPTAKLLNHYRALELGCPRYQFFEMPGKMFQVQITLPDGSFVTGSSCKTKELASDSAALEALNKLNYKESSFNVDCSQSNLNSNIPNKINTNERKKEQQPVGKKDTFLQSQRLRKNPGTSQESKEKSEDLKDLVKSNIKRKDIYDGNNKKKASSSSSFVPLQAIRNVKKKAEKAQESTTETKGIANENKLTQPIASKENENVENIDRKNNHSAKEAKMKFKRERKMRIAANFQAVAEK